MSLTRYVLMVVIDPKTRTAVGLIKKKGPSFLLNKITFPGGRMETDELPGLAAGREMIEETGVEVNGMDWRLVEIRKTETSEMHVLAAVSANVAHAVTREEEPVMILQIDQHAALAQASPDQYTPDFLPVLNNALRVLKLMPIDGLSAV